MRSFVPTDELNARSREDIDLRVYCCVNETGKLASRSVSHTPALRFGPMEVAEGRTITMKIHEYQAKAILARHGVPVPRGEVAFNSVEAREIAHRLGGDLVVVKAQIHAGGRGKGGGVKLARSPDDAERIASAMIGMTLVTHQTGPEGRIVSRVLVEEGLQMARELYLSLVLDRQSGKPVMMASAAGGMDIEEVAASSPEKIVK